MQAREKVASLAPAVQTLLIDLKTGPLQHPTELLKIPSEGRAQWQALIIPGNPGVASFYKPLMQGLWKNLGGLVDVFCISQLGHNPQSQKQAPAGRCSLKDQIKHKAAFMREHMLLPGRPPAFILGHSIGAYMALHTVQQLEQTGERSPDVPEILQIFAVCPFLAVDATNSRQRFLRLVTRQPAVLGSAAALMGSLPAAVRRWIVTSYAADLEPHALEASLGLLHWQPAVNAAHLAKHEFADLDRPAEWPLLKSFGARVTVLCAPGDMWFSDAAFAEMELEVPAVQALLLEGQKHAFCTSTALSHAMADACTNILQDLALTKGSQFAPQQMPA